MSKLQSNNLNICVCGWYLDKFDAFYRTMWKLHHDEGINVHIVSNKPSAWLKVFDLPYNVRENKGLEFGAYDYYLKNIWDGKSDVLFLHDDIKFKTYMRNFEIMAPERILDGFKGISKDIDQAYIFNSRKEDVFNDGKHGRAFFCSQRLLDIFKYSDGFLFDDCNEGETGVGCNVGVEDFDENLKLIGCFENMKTRRKLYIPAIETKYRGGNYPIFKKEGNHDNKTASVTN
ncbi:hypothetical protein CMI37_15470 [Candidatus Pacearchaeota archaeon]|nr:hypothetical protein [Candidatus Pacearchaeota archaeon]|tara:strand:+ start:3778 stop:4470 length:693 start_codon:yes stop_codon:yes gene_type:complete